MDWTANSLGHPENWPETLRVAFGMCLRCDTIAAVYWGPEFRLLYNEATVPVLGDRHPSAFGAPASEIWQETWDRLGPVMAEVGRTGREGAGTNKRFALDSQGRRSESYFSYSFIPIAGADGKVEGIFGQGRETTALVVGERWLEVERRRFSQMFEQAPGFFALLDGLDHVIEFLNPAAMALIGQRDVIGKPAREALPEIEGQGFLDLLERAYNSGEAASGTAMPAMLQRVAGQPLERRYVDLVFQPIRNDGGTVAGIVVQGMDVTDRVAATKALQEGEDRFRLIAESAPVMLWMSDTNGKCLYLNAALREFWGVAEAEVPRFDWNPTIHPDDVAGLAGPWTEGMRTQAGFAVEARYRRSDGEYRILRTTAHPRHGAGGDFLGMIGVNVDVTETRRIERALRRETALLELLNRTGTAIAAELDLEAFVQIVTDVAVDLTGAQFGAFFYNVADEAGESYLLYSLSGVPRKAFANYPMPRNSALFRPIFAGEAIVRSDDVLKHPLYGLSQPYHGMPPDHPPVRSYLAAPVVARSGEVLGGLFFGHGEPGIFKPEHERVLAGIAAYAAIAIDNARLFKAAEQENLRRAKAEERLRALTETLEARVREEIAERRQAETALQQAQKMEAVGQLTGGVAHDFNNLLQVIAGNLQLLGRDVAGNDRAEQRVANALAGVSRGAKLAGQLLAFGRRQALEPKVINIGRLITGMDEMLRRTLGETISIETIASGGLWNCLVDPSQIENALLNLAINARDAMQTGGKLTIEVGNAYIDDAYARSHPDALPGQYVVLAVTDTGIGIPPEIVDRVFEPFFSTKGEGKGTGLGLSMVYGFVKQSGGHVRIYSEIDHGTTVKLYLPRSMSDEDATRPVDTGPIIGGAETVLVAEDDEGVRETAVEMLTELGYRVLKAKDAASALSVLESGVPVDLLFTDVVMPGPLKSPDLASKARERFPSMAVLFTSGYTENSIVHGGKLDPGVDLLPKPYTREALARKVRQVLADRLPIPARSNPTALPPSRVSRSKKLASGSKPNPLVVLLVEDEWLIRSTTAEMLAGLGHVVVEAANGEEALGLVESRSIDVIVTDLGLTGMSGSELAVKARQIRRRIAVVFATGQAQAPDVGLTGTAYLSKPYEVRDLERALISACEAV